MDFRVLEAGSKAFDFPTVITFEDLTVNFFNEKFRAVVPGITAGEPVGKFMKIRGIRELIKETAVAPCVAEINGRCCLCAYCRIESGFDMNYAFSPAVSDGSDCDAVRYLMMKLAVLYKCAGSDVVARKRNEKPAPGYDDLLRRIESCEGVSSAAGVEDFCGSVDITTFMTDVFGYYSKMRYGDESPRINILTDTDLVILNNASCIELISVFHFASKASHNGFIKIGVSSSDNDFTVGFVFKTSKHFSSRMFDANGKTDEKRIYAAMGFDGSDLIYAKKLALETGGQVDIGFDGDSVTASLTVPKIKTPLIHSPSFASVCYVFSKDVVRALLGCR